MVNPFKKLDQYKVPPEELPNSYLPEWAPICHLSTSILSVLHHQYLTLSTGQFQSEYKDAVIPYILKRTILYGYLPLQLLPHFSVPFDLSVIASLLLYSFEKNNVKLSVSGPSLPIIWNLLHLGLSAYHFTTTSLSRSPTIIGLSNTWPSSYSAWQHLWYEDPSIPLGPLSSCGFHDATPASDFPSCPFPLPFACFFPSLQCLYVGVPQDPVFGPWSCLCPSNLIMWH